MLIHGEQEFANYPIIFKNALSGVPFTHRICHYCAHVHLLSLDKYFKSSSLKNGVKVVSNIEFYKLISKDGTINTKSYPELQLFPNAFKNVALFIIGWFGL